MQTINFDISQLLKKIRSGHFLIPQFQRDFTWKEGQTRLLVDSIARNYPIGSLLILGKNEEVPLKSRKLDTCYPPKISEDTSIDSFDEPTSESYYVLDGQQRLTSVARVFLDAHPKRNYYFDLKKMHLFFKDENPCWIVSRARGKNNPDRKDNNKLIRTDIAIDQAKCDVYISEYIEDSGDFPEFKNDRAAARQAAARLKGIFEVIRKFSIPFVALENDAPLESVCRVFETINSTGTRLTTFDLAVARYYPEPDLKTLFENSKDKYPTISEYEIDGERILQILSLYHLREAAKPLEATRSALLSLEPRFIKETWDDAARNLAAACDWIKSLGATPKTQPPHGILVSIATALMLFPDSLNIPKFSTSLKRWYFCTTLAVNSAPATNYKIGDDFKNFCNFLEVDSYFLSYPRVFFTISELIEIKHTSNSSYKAIQALMRTTVKEDLLTGNNLEGELEDHHIYPYSLNKSGINKGKLNSIANKVLVSKTTNRLISDTNPDKYLSDLAKQHTKSGSTGDFDRRLSSCFIPYSSSDTTFESNLSPDNFDNFLNARAEMLISRIKEVVGDSWQPPINGDINLEDD